MLTSVFVLLFQMLDDKKTCMYLRHSLLLVRIKPETLDFVCRRHKLSGVNEVVRESSKSYQITKALCVCPCVFRWLRWPVQSGQPGHGFGQLHGASAADAAAAHVQPWDALADHGEPSGSEHDVQPWPDEADDHGQPADAAADGAKPRDITHAQ